MTSLNPLMGHWELIVEFYVSRTSNEMLGVFVIVLSFVLLKVKGKLDVVLLPDKNMIIKAGKSSLKLVKNVKFGKDRFTNWEDMNFQKSKFYMKTFGNLRLEATLAYQQRFSYKMSIFENSHLRNLWSDLFQTSHFY